MILMRDAVGITSPRSKPVAEEYRCSLILPITANSSAAIGLTTLRYSLEEIATNDLTSVKDSSWFCRKFSFELISGMISCGDSGCQERESDDGDQLQGGPFPTRYHAHGCALVCDVSFKLSACRRTDGGARGVDRPRDYPALGREIQSPIGRDVSAPQAPGVAQLAHGRDLHQDERRMALSLSRRGYTWPDD